MINRITHSAIPQRVAKGGLSLKKRIGNGSWSWGLAALTLLTGGTIMVEKRARSNSNQRPSYARPNYHPEVEQTQKEVALEQQIACDQLEAQNELVEALQQNIELIEDTLRDGILTREKANKLNLKLARLRVQLMKASGRAIRLQQIAEGPLDD